MGGCLGHILKKKKECRQPEVVHGQTHWKETFFL